MASLSQLSAVTGKKSPYRVEDFNRARLPSLYAANENAARERQLAQSEEGLRLREREIGLMNSRENTATLVQGAGTVIQGAGLVETAFPGSLSNVGKSLGFGGSSGATGVAATQSLPAVTSTAPISGIPGISGAPLHASIAGIGGAAVGAAGASALTSTTPIAGLTGISGAPLSASLAAPVASGAATASGLGAAATTVPGTTAAATTAGSAGAAAGTGSLASLGGLGGAALSAAGGAGAGFAGGMLGKAIGPSILPFGGKTGEKIESGLTGAAAGAGLGFMVGGPLGAVVGGLLGGVTASLSVIATATYGINSPETQLAQRYRKRYIGRITYLGYRKWADPIARLIERKPIARKIFRPLLVDPCLRAMSAELEGLPAHKNFASRQYLKLWLLVSRKVGEREYMRLKQTVLRDQRGSWQHILALSL